METNLQIFIVCLYLYCVTSTVASDKVYQLLAHGRWFSSGTPVSSTTKTGGHDIAEILLKVALNTKIKSNLRHMETNLQIFIVCLYLYCVTSA
jgi:hypothetical protein